MAWDFETDPGYQAKLDWADEFVRAEIEPLDLVFPGLMFTPPDEKMREIINPKARTASSTTRTSDCPLTRCSARRTRPSRSRRPGSAAAASTTRCARSARRKPRWT